MIRQPQIIVIEIRNIAPLGMLRAFVVRTRLLAYVVLQV